MANLLKISEAASLALHTMSYIAAHKDKYSTTHEIAQVLQVSENHLSKVCQRLVKAGFIHAVRGPGGGMKLGKPADQINLKEIYEIIDGQIGNNYCLLGKPVCDGSGCVLGDLLKSVNDEVRNYFENTTLALFE